MYIETVGTGPALVMIHGWAMHGGVFAPLVERLRERYTLHIVDMPGHGRSRDSLLPLELARMATQIASETPPALWLGWSLGGLVALQGAQQLPDSLRGLIMLASTPRFVRGDGWDGGMDPALFAGFAEHLERDYRTTLDRFLMLEAQGSDHVRDELRQLREIVYAFGEPPQQVLREGLARLQDSDLRAGLPVLSVPSLWIAGRRDRLVSPASMKAAVALTPQSQFVQIEHGGHAPFLSHADEVADAIEAFSLSLPA
ncbi:MAG TPA: pimeloyl-ACP methyl ester esterase BioH [Arenimonas sp.]|uniref:pimeloyl-ACP methyl ester esterase BioH n=1 Tax=Arenimonas sp. TaxID=1872635 RepID=UPI002BC0FD58|nr:pimeloyl-ACP methyl ester esterase BioH [Arenimonas sp.]HMB57702.1 pimeloyl-ACP methyl ester esterase BioH [Arenimonas sp.]